jgi:hypothetical protein
MREREDNSRRPGDIIMVLDYYIPDKHLLVDGVITIVCKNTCLKKTPITPRYATKQDEDMKLYTNKASAKPVWGTS